MRKLLYGAPGRVLLELFSDAMNTEANLIPDDWTLEEDYAVFVRPSRAARSDHP